MSNQAVDLIGKWVINDYFTPNIKAEVILDTLLTPYIGQILKKQCDIDAAFLTKEMSLEEYTEEDQQSDDRGAKIDYLLVGEYVYLAELKTTTGGINAPQAERYLKNCCNLNGKPKTFGDVFGDKLLRIVNKMHSEIPSSPQGLKDAFQAFVGGDGKNAERARQYLKKRSLAVTHKYLYTIGQILDNYPDLDALWGKRLRLLYITPTGKLPHDKLLSASHFYLYPKKTNGKEPGSISLRDAVKTLDCTDELAGLLQSIVNEIYPAEDNHV